MGKEMIIRDKFTSEEIFFIKLCRSTRVEGAIHELKELVQHVAPNISESMHITINKLSLLCDEEYMELRNSPEDQGVS